mgnify:CR=1 FL=1|jgi:hypothetical protein|tara:strand:+ start:181 stop:384 length:204 start_codon:yes stop_codon:yes gene_type:complete
MITSTAKEKKDRKTTGNEKRLEIKIKTKKIETHCRINKNIKKRKKYTYISNKNNRKYTHIKCNPTHN